MTKPMNRSTRRELLGEKVISKSLTDDGRDWFVMAMDPFHDYSRQLAGFPDADGSATVVSCYQYELDVSKPAGVVGNWDAHVFTLPTMSKTTLTPFSVVNGPRMIQAIAGENTISVAPLNVYCADAGQPLCPAAGAAFAPTNLAMTNLDCLTDAVPGRSRVIGWGVEVVNTSAEIYKQGALTMYRMPQDNQLDQFNTLNSANTRSTNRLTTLMRTPPPTADQAMKLHGSVQWGASDGLYMVVPQNNVNNPMTCPTGVDICIADKTQQAFGDRIYVNYPSEFDSPTVNAGTALCRAGPSAPYYQKYVPFNTVGAFLTGLSPQTTLRIKMKLYVELAPTPIQSSLVVLATPSAGYDYKALALYSAAVSMLPVSVRVSENAAGDWFRRILDIVGMVGMPLGLAFGQPGLGAAVSSAATAVRKAIPENASAVVTSKKKKKKAVSTSI